MLKSTFELLSQAPRPRQALSCCLHQADQPPHPWQPYKSKAKLGFDTFCFLFTFSAARCAWQEQHPSLPESFLMTLSCWRTKGRGPVKSQKLLN